MTKRSKGAASETWVYGYDFAGRMVTAAKSATDGGAATARVTYTYDVFGNRIERQAWDGTNTTTERYVVDGWDTAKGSAVGSEHFDTVLDLDGSNAVTARRLFGAGFDEPLMRQSGGAVSWYVADAQGSVRQVLDSAGGVVGTLAYSAFGVASTVSGSVDRYRYTGAQWDEALGLQYNRARLYDPASGKWLSADPEGFAAGDANLYRYVGNQATTARDPSGKFLYQNDKPTADHTIATLQAAGIRAQSIELDSTWRSYYLYVILVHPADLAKFQAFATDAQEKNPHKGTSAWEVMEAAFSSDKTYHFLASKNAAGPVVELGRHLNEDERSAYYGWSLKVAAEYFREAKEDTSTFGADIREYLEWLKKQPAASHPSLDDPYRPKYRPSDEDRVRQLVAGYMRYKRNIVSADLKTRPMENPAVALQAMEAEYKRIQAQAAATLGSLKAEAFVCEKDADEAREARRIIERNERMSGAFEFMNGFAGVTGGGGSGAMFARSPVVVARVAREPGARRGEPRSGRGDGPLGDPLSELLNPELLEVPGKLYPPKLHTDILPGARYVDPYMQRLSEWANSSANPAHQPSPSQPRFGPHTRKGRLPQQGEWYDLTGIRLREAPASGTGFWVPPLDSPIRQSPQWGTGRGQIQGVRFRAFEPDFEPIAQHELRGVNLNAARNSPEDQRTGTDALRQQLLTLQRGLADDR